VEPGSSSAPAAPGLKLQADEPQAAAAKANDAQSPPEKPKLRLRKATTLKDELADIVREDPDAAADILRSWIGKAG